MNRLTLTLLAAGAVCVGGALLDLQPVDAGARVKRPVHATGLHKQTPQISPEDDTDYASPLEMMLSPDGRLLYVLCQQARELRALDATTGRTVKTVEVGQEPRGIAMSRSGDRIYVTNSWDDTLSVIETSQMKVVATWPVGMEPSGVAYAENSEHKPLLYIANRISNDVAVLDATTGKELRRLVAGRGASYVDESSDHKRLYVTHVYPRLAEHRGVPQSEVTVIDTGEARVADRMPLHEIAGVFHTAISNDGRLGVIAELHPKNLVPLAHVEHGWGFVDTLTVFGADAGREVEVPLDELDRYYARPFGVAIAPDKSRIYVSHGGSNVVTVLNTAHLMRYIHAHPEPFAEDLSASANYVAARIPVGRDPRGVLLTADGRRLFVANRLDDTISVINTQTDRVVNTFVLEGPKEVTAHRRGEQTFYSASFAFQGQFGCANCHIDSTFDGLEWDLEPDGFGVDIVDNRLLENLRDTEPYKWNGGNPNIPTECGSRTEMYFWRSQNYDDLVLSDLTLYVLGIPERPNRWRLPHGELTQAQERGKELFERSVDRFGKPIPESNRCSFCHSGPKGTDQKSFDVDTGKATDRSGVFDTPQLMNIALTAPYLHDGSAKTLEEIWTIYNPHDKHGRTNDLTKDELNDLIEYLRTR